MKTHKIEIFEPENTVDCDNIFCSLCYFYIKDYGNCLQAK